MHGFISATLFADDQEFGLGNGQNAMWAALPELERDPWFHGGDVRNTRLTLGFNGSELIGDWKANATLELDLFGGFTGQGTFSDQQPNPRLRLAFVDLTNGRTTLRLGQNWSPTFGYAPESLSHIGFPPGWGSGGLIGWRFPGVFLYHDLTSGGANTLQLQVAAFRGSFSDLDKPDDVSAGEATLRPQLGGAHHIPSPDGSMNGHRHTERTTVTIGAVPSRSRRRQPTAPSVLLPLLGA